MCSVPETESQSPGFTPERISGGRRLLRALTARPKIGHIFIGLLVGLLAFGAVQQVRTDDDVLLDRARRTDLVQILDGVTQRADRLEEEIAEAEEMRAELDSGVDSGQAAREQAAEREEQLGILAGVEPASGPGVQITITDPDREIQPTTALAVLHELRAAGAEAMQIHGDNGTSVRMVASTHVSAADGGLSVSGQALQPPYVIDAIGDPRNLEQAIAFVPALSDGDGAGDVTITDFSELTVDTLHEPEEAEYARPAPDQTD